MRLYFQTLHQLLSGYTLLHLAVVEGRTSEVSLLLGRGANTNVKDSEYDFCSYLYILRFKMRVVFHSGTTPLHWAAHRGLVAIAGMLLDMRADINSKDIGFDRLFIFR